MFYYLEPFILIAVWGYAVVKIQLQRSITWFFWFFGANFAACSAWCTLVRYQHLGSSIITSDRVLQMVLEFTERLRFNLGCHNTLTRARTPRLHWNAVLSCIVTLRLSPTIIISLRNSIHSPEMQINPPKKSCGCPCHTRSPLTLTAFGNVQLHVPRDSQCVHLGNAATGRLSICHTLRMSDMLVAIID